MYEPLSVPVEAWHFDLRAPAEHSEERTLDLAIERPGVLNAIMFWFKLRFMMTWSSALGQRRWLLVRLYTTCYELFSAMHVSSICQPSNITIGKCECFQVLPSASCWCV